MAGSKQTSYYVADKSFVVFLDGNSFSNIDLLNKKHHQGIITMLTAILQPKFDNKDHSLLMRCWTKALCHQHYHLISRYKDSDKCMSQPLIISVLIDLLFDDIRKSKFILKIVGQNQDYQMLNLLSQISAHIHKYELSGIAPFTHNMVTYYSNEENNNILNYLFSLNHVKKQGGIIYSMSGVDIQSQTNSYVAPIFLKMSDNSDIFNRTNAYINCKSPLMRGFFQSCWIGSLKMIKYYIEDRKVNFNEKVEEICSNSDSFQGGFSLFLESPLAKENKDFEETIVYFFDLTSLQLNVPIVCGLIGSLPVIKLQKIMKTKVLPKMELTQLTHSDCSVIMGRAIQQYNLKKISYLWNLGIKPTPDNLRYATCYDGLTIVRYSKIRRFIELNDSRGAIKEIEFGTKDGEIYSEYMGNDVVLELATIASNQGLNKVSERLKSILIDEHKRDEKHTN